MIEHVEYSDDAADFLRTHPHADEARVVIRLIRQGRHPGSAWVDPAGNDVSFALLPESDRYLWWYYTGDRREILVIDITEIDH